MFDQFNGLPLHPLVVHAAVVFVPLLVVTAILYGLVPQLRSRIGWVAVLLAVAAPAAALVAMLSGQAFKESRFAGQPAEALQPIVTHEGYGELNFWFSLGLGVATGLLVAVTRRRSVPKVAEIGLIVVVFVVAVVTGYFVFRTGDSGAQAVYGS